VQFCEKTVDFVEKLKEFVIAFILAVGVVCYITQNYHRANLELIYMGFFLPFVWLSVLIARRARRRALIHKMTLDSDFQKARGQLSMPESEVALLILSEMVKDFLTQNRDLESPVFYDLQALISSHIESCS
jgi:hypothetical protein